MSPLVNIVPTSVNAAGVSWRSWGLSESCQGVEFVELRVEFSRCNFS